MGDGYDLLHDQLVEELIDESLDKLFEDQEEAKNRMVRDMQDTINPRKGKRTMTTATPKTVPRPTTAPGTQQLSRKMSLGAITTTARNIPPRIVIHAVEGIGKTSLGASAKNPVFLMSKGETGLETLVTANRLPETPHFPEIQTWQECLDAITALEEGDHDYKTIVFDALNGFERQCHEHVCARDFNNDWTDRGFMGYMRGYEVACADWRDLLNRIDSLQAKRNMVVILLCHTRAMNFKNPEGADYDRYTPDVHHKTWSLTHRWADVVLFGNFVTLNTESDTTKHGKGLGGTERVLYTERRAAYDAKNRHGMPEQLSMGTSGPEAWANIVAAIKGEAK